MPRANSQALAQAGSKARVLGVLEKLYPHLSKQDFQTKLEGAKTPFLFLRTFVPYYFYHLAHNPLPEAQSQDLGRLSGWCVGDAHLENFGVLLDDQGETIFAMNDMDDAGPCPLYSDFVRFLTSALLFDEKMDLDPLVKVYEDAVMGDAPSYSKLIRKIAKDAEDERYLNFGKNDQQYLEREEGSQELSAEELRTLAQVLSSALHAKTTILDSFKMKKASGGSGGLTRIRARISYNDGTGKKPRTTTYEFKQLQRPGIFPLASAPIPKTAQRFKRTMDLELGAGVNSIFFIRKVLGMEMLLRPRWKGNVAIALKDFDKDDIRTIAADEANALGRFHLRSAKNIVAYRNAIRNMSRDEWKSMAQKMAGIMSSDFKVLR